jgi:hypothetical protein
VSTRRPLRTTTRSAIGDSCFLAKQRSHRTAWRARSLLSRTKRAAAGTRRGARCPLLL